MGKLKLGSCVFVLCTLKTYAQTENPSLREKKIPQSVWQKGRALAGDVVVEGGRVLIPELISRLLPEAPIANLQVPPNFKRLLADSYLGDFNQLDTSQSRFAMDCYAKHLRHVDNLNKGIGIENQITEFAYSVENNRCVSHYFNSLEYQRSVFPLIESLRGKCLWSSHLGRVMLPIEIDRSQDNYLMLRSHYTAAAEDDVTRVPTSQETEGNFWNEARNISGKFLGPVAMVKRYYNGHYFLESEFSYSSQAIRGTASEPSQGQIGVRIGSQQGEFVLEHRIQQPSGWTQWEPMLSCP